MCAFGVEPLPRVLDEVEGAVDVAREEPREVTEVLPRGAGVGGHGVVVPREPSVGGLVECGELLHVVELNEAATDAVHGPLQEPIAALLDVDGSAESARIEHGAA